MLDGGPRPEAPVVIPAAYAPLFWRTMPDGTPIRYRVFYGGRGAAKSSSFARALTAQAYSDRHLILCTRQFQNSITDSVYRVVEQSIYAIGVQHWFEFTRNSIYCKRTESEFIFKGLERNINEIRSLEGVTRCWLEEANSTRFDSWTVLDPTIRRPGSEIWISYNPEFEEDPIHKKFVVDPAPRNALVRKTSWRDNPFFKKTALYDLRLDWLKHHPDTYDWVWEGECRRISEAAIFRGTFDVEPFDTPRNVDRFYFGADWGFANDPSVLIRCWIADEVLYIDYEAYAVGVEIDDLPALFAGGVAAKTGVSYPGVPGCLEWPIFADSARPETISYLARRAPGFPIHPAEKWRGSVEDGIAHLKGFRRIKIHPRCENTAREFRLYSYATDPHDSRIILPKIVDKHNHAIDACRYALGKWIMQRGNLGVWARLAS
jgi:phage terminase large subunit